MAAVLLRGEDRCFRSKFPGGRALDAKALTAVLVELGPLLRDATVKFYPAVFLANALAAFILNLVRRLAQESPVTRAGAVHNWLEIVLECSASEAL